MGRAEGGALSAGGRGRYGISTLGALTPGAVVRGLPDAAAAVVAASWFEDNALELAFKVVEPRWSSSLDGGAMGLMADAAARRTRPGAAGSRRRPVARAYGGAAAR